MVPWLCLMVCLTGIFFAFTTARSRIPKVFTEKVCGVLSQGCSPGCVSFMVRENNASELITTKRYANERRVTESRRNRPRSDVRHVCDASLSYG